MIQINLTTNHVCILKRFGLFKKYVYYKYNFHQHLIQRDLLNLFNCKILRTNRNKSKFKLQFTLHMLTIRLYSCITLFVEQVCSLFAVDNSMQISWRLITWNLRQVYVVTEVLPEFHRTWIDEWITKTEPDHNQKFSFDDLLSWRQEIKSFLSNEINLVIYHYFILFIG